jgi:hypothetical protein
VVRCVHLSAVPIGGQNSASEDSTSTR